MRWSWESISSILSTGTSEGTPNSTSFISSARFPSSFPVSRKIGNVVPKIPKVNEITKKSKSISTEISGPKDHHVIRSKSNPKIIVERIPKIIISLQLSLQNKGRSVLTLNLWRRNQAIEEEQEAISNCNSE